MTEQSTHRTESSYEVVTDVLGAPWVAETIPLEPDFEGEVVATLVSRRTGSPTDRATLHVHGFSDYFFHAEHGEWWIERGHDMYGLDLRKYGRSLRPHQSATYVADLAEYFEELDAAWERITVRDGHTRVVLTAHSTGGLIVSLWADSRKPTELAGLVLNSPWLDLQGRSWMRSPAMTTVIDRVGRRQPMRELRREVTGFYTRSLHREHDGEWDFDLTWKPLGSFPVRFGWLRAIRIGHAQVQRGLDVPAPVLVLSSDRSSAPRELCDDVFCTDLVLDVRQIRRWATAVGKHTTYIAIPGAVHDVLLSRPTPRKRAYDEIDRWLSTYVS
ncbi:MULTISPECIES: alpha/beta hydrolase [Nocardioides]|uniref:Alpha/beta hydrolase n=1 Tax=Nocardioides vastitatis TaxID=2568655 RepID=A0ABW0ZIJ8_9ACTN|nr:alpha/beta hydrolase [Nocardioides sp.]THI91120.1 alpha/beta hydrolase [Nocardioides sp.]